MAQTKGPLFLGALFGPLLHLANLFNLLGPILLLILLIIWLSVIQGLWSLVSAEAE